MWLFAEDRIRFYVIEQKAEEGNMAPFHDTINRKRERASAAVAIICLEAAEVRTFPSYDFRFMKKRRKKSQTWIIKYTQSELLAIKDNLVHQLCLR